MSGFMLSAGTALRIWTGLWKGDGGRGDWRRSKPVVIISDPGGVRRSPRTCLIWRGPCKEDGGPWWRGGAGPATLANSGAVQPERR